MLNFMAIVYLSDHIFKQIKFILANLKELSHIFDFRSCFSGKGLLVTISKKMLDF